MTRYSDIYLAFFAILMFAGCNNTFEPLQENTKYVFSMYGTLDIHADTQWVRVMPIGDRLFNDSPEPNGTIVTLMRITTGEIITLNDSLFSFGGPSYVWNYWTTEPLVPDEPYYVIATDPDGNTSTATVITPKPLPDPVIEYNRNLDRGNVDGQNEQWLVVARINFFIQVMDDFGRWDTEYMESVSVLNTAYTSSITRTYRFSYDTRPILTRQVGVPFSRIRVNRMQVQVASGLHNWPSYYGLSDEEIVMPDVITNVHNGTGYIAAVASKTLDVN